jgi:hypothetical protein
MATPPAYGEKCALRACKHCLPTLANSAPGIEVLLAAAALRAL